MKKLIVSLIFLTGCQDITQDQIDEAARRQLNLKNECEIIAQSLDAVAEYKKENEDWLCLVYNKKNLNNPRVVFYQSDLSPINRYLYIKNKK